MISLPEGDFLTVERYELWLRDREAYRAKYYEKVIYYKGHKLEIKKQKESYDFEETPEALLVAKEIKEDYDQRVEEIYNQPPF